MTDRFDDVVSGAPGEDTLDRGDDPALSAAAHRLQRSRIPRLDAWAVAWLADRRHALLWRWGAPAIVTLLAAVLRLWHVGSPDAMIFDETFYVKDAWSQWMYGYSSNWPVGALSPTADAQFIAGTTTPSTVSASYVVHPQFGKLLMGFFEMLFGPSNPVGWRMATALAGIAGVWLLMIVTRRLFRSTLLAVIAGFILAIEGFAIVMSRVAILDNLVMIFALLGAYFALLDRDAQRRYWVRWAFAHRHDARRPQWGPVFWKRPWLWASAVTFGLDTGVKWSGVYFLAAFAVYAVLVDLAARKRAGLPLWISAGLLKQAPITFLYTVPIGLVVYLLTWLPWIVTKGGWDRDYVQTYGTQWKGSLAWVPDWFQNLAFYHLQMYQFASELQQAHPAITPPWQWPLLVNPTNMYYVDLTTGQNGCTAASCVQTINSVANPLLWWTMSAAMIYVVYRLIRRRDPIAGFAIIGLAGGWLPWLLTFSRTAVFQFYTIAYEPFLVLGLVLVIREILGSPHDPPERRIGAVRLVAVFLGVATLVSVFYWPIWTAQTVTTELWRLHMWLPTWP